MIDDVEEQDGRVTPRRALADRRSSIAAEQWIDLRVPRWSEPEIWIRYRPATVAKIEGSAANRRKQKVGGKPLEDWLVLANADVLVDACIAVFELPAGAAPSEPEEGGDKVDRLKYASVQWDGFGPDLAADLGVSSSKAVDVLRALFITDGDVMQHAAAVSDFSGTAGVKVDELFEGESEATRQ